MSQLTDDLRRRRPDWNMIPAELERAWAWLEAQGLGLKTPAGRYLRTSRDENSRVAFASNLSLKGWLAPDSRGYAQLLPVADAAGDGSMIALWHVDGEVRVVFLGSEGDTSIVADDAREFLSLLAIGYDELTSITFGAEPSEPVDVTEYREWLITEFGSDVPTAWPALEDDAFTAWMAAQRGEKRSEIRPVIASTPNDNTGTSITGDVMSFLKILGEPDGAEAASLAARLLETELGDTLRSSSRALKKHGVEVTSTRTGITTVWIHVPAYPRPSALIRGLTETTTISDARSIMGEPESAGSVWVRYVLDGKYVHLEFGRAGTLSLVTLMTEAP